GRDVRVDAHGEDGETAQGAAGEQVQEAEDVAASDVQALCQADRVDAGDRNEGADAKDREERRRVDQLATEVVNAPCVPERVQQLDHLGLPTGGLDLLDGRLGKAVRPDRQRDFEV